MRKENIKKEEKFQDNNIKYKIRSSFSKYYEENLEVKKLINSNLSNSSGRLLVLGCGNVDVTQYLKYGFEKIYAIDISSICINQIKSIINYNKLNNKVFVYIMDAHDLKFNNEFFDYIIGTGIIHHLNINKCFKELKRVAKSDGKILFLEPLGLNPFLNIFRKITSYARTKEEHPLLPKDFKIINKHFKTINLKGFYLLTIFSYFFKMSIKNRCLYKYTRNILLKLDYFILKIFPFMKYFCWIMVITGKK